MDKNVKVKTHLQKWIVELVIETYNENVDILKVAGEVNRMLDNTNEESSDVVSVMIKKLEMF